MKQQKPRRQKPVMFDFKVYHRDGTILNIKDEKIDKLKEILEMLEKKL